MVLQSNFLVQVKEYPDEIFCKAPPYTVSLWDNSVTNL